MFPSAQALLDFWEWQDQIDASIKKRLEDYIKGFGDGFKRVLVQDVTAGLDWGPPVEDAARRRGLS